MKTKKKYQEVVWGIYKSGRGFMFCIGRSQSTVRERWCVMTGLSWDDLQKKHGYRSVKVTMSAEVEE